MSNKFLGASNGVNDYAREPTLEQIEDTLTNGTINVNIESGGDGNSTIISPIGSDVVANSVSVAIASDQPAITVTANAGTNLNTSLLALETGGNLATIAGDTTSLDTKVPSQGQAVMASSMPVVISSNQTAIPVTGTGSTDYIDLLEGNVSSRVGRVKFGYRASITDSTDSTNVIAYDSTNNYDIDLIGNTSGLACSLVTTNNSLTNFDIRIEYYQTQGATTTTVETITLNGNTAVPLSNNVYRVLSMRRSDTSQSGSGTTYLFETSAGSTGGAPDDESYWHMDNGSQVDSVAVIYAPTGKRIYIDRLTISSSANGANNTHEIQLTKYPINDTQQQQIDRLFSNGNLQMTNMHYRLEQNETLSIRARRVDGVDNLPISCHIDYTEYTF